MNYKVEVPIGCQDCCHYASCSSVMGWPGCVYYEHKMSAFEKIKTIIRRISKWITDYIA